MQKKRIFWALGALLPLAAVLTGCSGGSGGPVNTGGNGGNGGNTGANSANFYGVTNGGQLIRFNATNPQTLGSTNVALSGLQVGEQVVGLDFRPANGQLYALTNLSRLYTLNTSTGAATVVGAAPFTPVLSGGAFGFDFNPAVDRIRVVGDTGQNFRLNPNDGTNAGTDTNIAFAAGDVNASQVANVFSIAYSNNFNPAPATTTLYGIDTKRDALVRIGGVDGNPSPNTGQLTTVGSLGVDAGNDVAAFDIGANGQAYAVLGVSSGFHLFRINLQSGAASDLGGIANNALVTNLAIAP